MKFLEGVGAFVVGGVVLVALIGLGWFFMANDVAMHKTFDPQYEQVRRETFEKSRAFNEGMIKELQNMQFEYVKASAEHKDALASIILHRVAGYDEKQLPVDLRSFVSQLRRERTSVQ